jgi:hypothetical protein
MSDKTKQLRCNKCGAFASSPVPLNTVVRGWIECPECIEKEPNVDTLRAELHAAKVVLADIASVAVLPGDSVALGHVVRLAQEATS